MISYLSIDRIEEKIAVCELEMIPMEESNTEKFDEKETKMVDVPIDKFGACELVNEGDIFVAVHDEGNVLEICYKDNAEKTRRIALLDTICEAI